MLIISLFVFQDPKDRPSFEDLVAILNEEMTPEDLRIPSAVTLDQNPSGYIVNASSESTSLSAKGHYSPISSNLKVSEDPGKKGKPSKEVAMTVHNAIHELPEEKESSSSSTEASSS